jgi:hypothetical protein
MKLRSHQQSSTAKTNLPALMIAARGFPVYNPIDKVYGMLGIGHGYWTERLDVNYSLPLAVVYIAMTKT